MSWLARRNREQFTGWIAGFGTDSGHRVVIGHWAASPYGVVTDVMVEDPSGHRTLYAPTPHLAEFLTAAYASTTSGSPPVVSGARARAG